MAQAAMVLESTSEGQVVAPKPQNAEIGGSPRPVDLVHLAKQSLGDRALEVEILALFRSQSDLYLSRLGSAKSVEERKMAAHTILGSARGIGAWDVAHEAEKIELGAAKPNDLSQLSAAISSAQDYISDILGD